MTAAASSAPLLELRDVSVAAGGERLLQRVSLRLAAGEGVALIGPSGCGKTTLLRAVAGLDAPAAGDVLLAGRAPDDHGWPCFRRSVVMVAQTPAMLPGTVQDNLERPFAYHTAHAPFPAERAAALLDRLLVGARRLSQPAETLSVGQQQRVALARALLVGPRALLLDEPTSGLDEGSRDVVESLLAEEREGGISLLVVTHDPLQAGRLATRTMDLAAHVVPGAAHAA